jgi:hypothetical protein
MMEREVIVGACTPAYAYFETTAGAVSLVGKGTRLGRGGTGWPGRQDVIGGKVTRFDSGTK